jgi:nitric-oxide synthase, bacterial
MNLTDSPDAGSFSGCPVHRDLRNREFSTESSELELEFTGKEIADPVQALITQARHLYALPEMRPLAGLPRIAHVESEIRRTGGYRHTAEELLLGAKIAWRNHARCSGRYSSQRLELMDARDATTSAQVAQACIDHLVRATNGGRLRPAITVFAARSPEIRIHSPQLIRYAGYVREGRVIGDPMHVALTRTAEEAGWVGRGTAFDVLPLLISVDGHPPEAFDIPAEAVLEVPIRHPRFEWFAELGLRWHAVPAVSDMYLDLGGVMYPTVFNGWYVNTEIGARNLSDPYRYNQLPVIAERMGLDTRRKSSLWLDRALLELNDAVLHSYAEAGVYMVDHHTVADQFVNYVERRQAAGHAVPTDWAWINPPMSGSTTRTFHRTFDPPDFEVRPNFVRRADRADRGLIEG